MKMLKKESLIFQIKKSSFKDGDTRWFTGGKLNVSENCVDRHARQNPDHVLSFHYSNQFSENNV